MSTTIERRVLTGEVEARQKADGNVVVAGYAAAFNQHSQLLGGRFVEQVSPRAFTKTLADGGEVRAYRNHAVDYVLGSLRAGTLRLATDNTGLHYEYDSPDTTYARDLLALIERRDVRTSSFAFAVVGRDGESWGYTDDEIPLRTLNEVRLFDVSPITASPRTATQPRSRFRSVPSTPCAICAGSTPPRSLTPTPTPLSARSSTAPTSRP